MELYEFSASDLAKMVSWREASSEEIVRSFLARITEVNPIINAAVQVFEEEALVAARKADTVRNPKAPLHGVPFTAKDIFDIAGQISCAGLPSRRAFRPAVTAVAVERLLAAGAILIAKTNCPPGGGGGETANEVYGRTLNPFMLSRTPGGSSGGEAALVVARGSPLGLGSDSGGSLRFPAHCCGVFCLKPTTGRIPNIGALCLPGGLSDPRTQIGPMARSVEDIELAYGILAGPDFRDTGTVPVPVAPSAMAWQRLCRKPRVRFFATDGDMEPTPEIATAVRKVADILRQHDVDISEGAPPYCPRRSLEITRRYWSGKHDKLLADWDEFRSSLSVEFSQWDIFLGPVCATTAPAHGGTVSGTTFQYTLPYSLLGSPCLVVPATMSSEGLPICVQLAASPWQEDILLALGLLLEKYLCPCPCPLMSPHKS